MLSPPGQLGYRCIRNSEARAAVEKRSASIRRTGVPARRGEDRQECPSCGYLIFPQRPCREAPLGPGCEACRFAQAQWAERPPAGAGVLSASIQSHRCGSILRWTRKRVRLAASSTWVVGDLCPESSKPGGRTIADRHQRARASLWPQCTADKPRAASWSPRS